ncbi:DUF6328 family protein [Flindersiella endophytica]
MDELTDQRGETPAQRADRNFGELLQELRVLQTGVQILFGFVLIMSVQPLLHDSSRFTKTVYLVVLGLCCVSTALLMGPAAYHRMLFGKGRKAEVVKGSHLLARGGIVALMLSICAAVLLVTDLVAGRTMGWIFTVLVLLFFVAVWYALPAIRGRLAEDPPRRPTEEL